MTSLKTFSSYFQELINGIEDNQNKSELISLIEEQVADDTYVIDRTGTP